MDTPETPPNGSETFSETPAATDRNSFDLSVLELRKKRLSIREIARQLRCSPSKVDRSIRRATQQFAEDYGLKHLSSDAIQAHIFGFAPRAVNQIQKLALGARKEEVQLKASVDMLDRAGFAPVQKQFHVNIYEEMSIDQLRSVIRSIIAAAEARAPGTFARAGTPAITDANQPTPSALPQPPECRLILNLP